MKLTSIIWMLLVALGCYSDVIKDAQRFIKENESFRAHRYRDARGLAIGYGFTDPRYTRKETMSQYEADRILVELILDIDQFIDKTVSADLSNNQRIALIDFIYQFGKTRFRNSYLRSLINYASSDKVIIEMARYNRVNGQYNRGVADRTQRRIALWQK